VSSGQLRSTACNDTASDPSAASPPCMYLAGEHGEQSVCCSVCATIVESVPCPPKVRPARWYCAARDAVNLIHICAISALRSGAGRPTDFPPRIIRPTTLKSMVIFCVIVFNSLVMSLRTLEDVDLRHTPDHA